jgi:hypothetical protein
MYQALLEQKLEELKIKCSATGEQFAACIDTSFCYQPPVPMEDLQSIIDAAKHATIFNRARAKSDGFSLNRLSILNPVHGESLKLVKVGIFGRRERVTRFGRLSSLSWIECGVILLDTKIMFVKGDLSLLKPLIDRENVDSRTFIPPMATEIIVDLAGTLALHDSSLSADQNTNVLRFISDTGDPELISFPTADELNIWLGLINYLATISSAQLPLSSFEDPALLRRRAETTLSPAGRPVPLRAVSSTLELRARSKSEQAPSRLLIPDKSVQYAAFREDLQGILPLQRITLQSCARQLRGLLLQAPVQERSRTALSAALERVTRRYKWIRLEVLKMECYTWMLDFLVSVANERMVRLVEKESAQDDFQLPVLGFSGKHKRSSPSQRTTDTMLSSETLFTALHPSDTDDIPIRSVGRLSSVASMNQDREVTRGRVLPEVVVQELTIPAQDTSTTIPQPRSHSFSRRLTSPRSTATLRVTNLTAAIQQAGF